MKPYQRKKPRKYIWIAYDKEKPGLPIAVADTSTELAEILGVSKSTVVASTMNGRRNRFKHDIYAKVEVEDAD